jgi:hypothetical protein
VYCNQSNLEIENALQQLENIEGFPKSNAIYELLERALNVYL